MANLKNITELPVAESAEGLKLIVNDNGAAKQIAASAVGAQADFAITDENDPGFIKNKPEVVQADWAETDEANAAFIKNKPHRELVYEWNFEASNDVGMILENIDEDISWLTTPSSEPSWEIELSQYGYYSWSDEDGNWNYDIDPDVYSTAIFDAKKHNTTFQNNDAMFTYVCLQRLEDYMNDWSREYYNPCAYVHVYNKVHVDGDGEPTERAQGGLISVSVEGGGPFKSMKIYKVYH